MSAVLLLLLSGVGVTVNLSVAKLGDDKDSDFPSTFILPLAPHSQDLPKHACSSFFWVD